MSRANASESDDRKSVRQIAGDILVRVDLKKAYADVLLDRAFQQTSLDSKDRSLLNEIVYGTLRWRGRIDSYLRRLIRRPVEETDPFIRNLLRLTIYQADFLDRVPHYAAVNEAVTLAKRRSGARVGGFVNGVLRNFLRMERDSSPPDLDTSTVTDLGEYWSHPNWIIEMWIQYLGVHETAALLKANNNQGPLTLRVNSLRISRDALLETFQAGAVQASATAWSPDGIVVHLHPTIDQLPGYREGLFQVQGEASQLVAYLLAPQPGEHVLDACAAPGGKTTHIAQLMGDIGHIAAKDLSAKGIAKIKENATRLGLRSVRAVQADMTKRAAGGEVYDRILVDAPCSGLGTLRSHPEIKWNRDPSDVAKLSALQAQILSQAAVRLKNDGILVYSTCTLTGAENEAIVDQFLECHKSFVLEDAAESLPGEAKRLVRGKYFMALPHQHNTDGFFAARMRKVSQ